MHLAAETTGSSAAEPSTAHLRRQVSQRRVVIALAAAAAVIYVLPALAQDQALWWIRGGGDSFQPAGKIVTLGTWSDKQLRLDPAAGAVATSGFEAAGMRWRLQAFVSTQNELCIGLGPAVPAPANENSSVVCGQPVRGTPHRSGHGGPSEQHSAGFGVVIPGRTDLAETKIVYGPAAEDVRYVDLEHDGASVIRVPTLPEPAGLDAHARFWIAELPVDRIVNVIVSRDGANRALERWRLPIGQ
jgi:hypothetical protein